MYLTRGQPVVYYGDEQGFTGDGGDQDARQDMFPQPGRRVQRRRPDRHRRDDRAGQLRHQPPALPARSATWPGSGRPTPRSPTAPRSTATPPRRRRLRLQPDRRRGATVEYVVALNNSTTPRRSPSTPMRRRHLHRGLAGRPADRCAATTRVGSRSPCRRCPRGCGRPPAPLAARDDAPAVHFETPSAGGIVGGRAPDRGGRPGRRVQPGHARLASGGRRRVDTARHRRQRPLPRLPRRLGAARGHPGRVPRRAARQLGQPLGGLDVRHGRRPGDRADARRWREHRRR